MSIPKKMIEKAAVYLLKVLMEKKDISYDYFYDGTVERHSKLNKEIGLTDKEAEWYVAEMLIDIAAIQLEVKGVVKIKELESELSDGEKNYRIILTGKGRTKIEKGVKFRYYSDDPWYFR